MTCGSTVSEEKHGEYGNKWSKTKKREKIRLATIDKYNVSAGRTYLVGMKAGRWAV